MLRLGSIIAWILIVLGALRMAMGLFVAINFSSEGNAGIAIVQGIFLLFVGGVIGLLVRIARNGERKS